MKASISSWSYREWFNDGRIDLPAFVDEVARLGADGLEIFPRHIDPDNVGGQIKAVAEQARKAGLDVASVIAANDFACADLRQRADAVEKMKEWIGFCAAAGIERMNTFTGYHRDGQDPVAEVYRVVDAYREVMPTAREHGVLLCVENHSTVARDADGLMAILAMVGDDHLRTNPDPSNFVREFTTRSERACEAIYTETAKIAPAAANAHVKVGDFDEAGEHAHLDVPRLLGVLKDAGYDGHVVMEVYGENAAKPDETCKKGLEMLRRHF